MNVCLDCQWLPVDLRGCGSVTQVIRANGGLSHIHCGAPEAVDTWGGYVTCECWLCL